MTIGFELWNLVRGYNGSPSKQHQCMTRGSFDLQSEAVSQAFTMKRSPLELDPEADALLILQCPNLQQIHVVKDSDLVGLDWTGF
jgi:deoxycytidylate deaminase